MTNEDKICPVMSRPTMGNIVDLNGDPLYKDVDEMSKYGWTPVNGIPYQDIFPCQRERCMAWYGGCDLAEYLDLEAASPICQAKGEGCPEKAGVQCFGYCRLLEKGA